MTADPANEGQETRPAKRKRSTAACTSCRRLKQRCEPELNAPATVYGVCHRCYSLALTCSLTGSIKAPAQGSTSPSPADLKPPSLPAPPLVTPPLPTSVVSRSSNDSISLLRAALTSSRLAIHPQVSGEPTFRFSDATWTAPAQIVAELCTRIPHSVTTPSIDPSVLERLNSQATMDHLTIIAKESFVPWLGWPEIALDYHQPFLRATLAAIASRKHSKYAAYSHYYYHQLNIQLPDILAAFKPTLEHVCALQCLAIWGAPSADRVPSGSGLMGALLSFEKTMNIHQHHPQISHSLECWNHLLQVIQLPFERQAYPGYTMSSAIGMENQLLRNCALLFAEYSKYRAPFSDYPTEIRATAVTCVQNMEMINSKILQVADITINPITKQHIQALTIFGNLFKVSCLQTAVFRANAICDVKAASPIVADREEAHAMYTMVIAKLGIDLAKPMQDAIRNYISFAEDSPCRSAAPDALTMAVTFMGILIGKCELAIIDWFSTGNPHILMESPFGDVPSLLEQLQQALISAIPISLDQSLHLASRCGELIRKLKVLLADKRATLEAAKELLASSQQQLAPPPHPSPKGTEGVPIPENIPDPPNGHSDQMWNGNDNGEFTEGLEYLDPSQMSALFANTFSNDYMFFPGT